MLGASRRKKNRANSDMNRSTIKNATPPLSFPAPAATAAPTCCAALEIEAESRSGASVGTCCCTQRHVRSSQSGGVGGEDALDCKVVTACPTSLTSTCTSNQIGTTMSTSPNSVEGG